MTVEQMEDLLTRLDLPIMSVRGYEIQTICPAHLERTGHVDHNPSMWVNADTGAFICFSCQFKGGTTTLISYITKIPFDQASGWIESADGLGKRLERVVSPSPTFEEVTTVTESMLSAFTQPTAEMLRGRGLSPASAAKYEALYDPRKNAWVLPIREPLTGALLGWQEKGVDGRHFRNYPKGVQKSRTLFGYRTYAGGTMTVLESPLDAVRLHSVGIVGGVATYGSLVSTEQVNLIRGAERVLVAMDHDEAGRESSKKMLEFSKKYGFECLFFNYSETDQKDIGGMSASEIRYGIENARHSLRGERALT